MFYIPSEESHDDRPGSVPQAGPKAVTCIYVPLCNV